MTSLGDTECQSSLRLGVKTVKLKDTGQATAAFLGFLSLKMVFS